MDDAAERTSRVIRVARHFELLRREIVAARDLDLWEYDVLVALRAATPHELSAGALIGETLVASGTMTNRIDRLSRRGYVTREPDPTDRRGVLVRLATSGRRKIDLVASDVSDAEAATWKSLGARDGANLDAAASALLLRFDE